MQSPILFQLGGPLVAGRYLPGHYAWPLPAALTLATVRCPLGIAGGFLTLALEVGGVLTGDELVLGPGFSGTHALALARPVAAGAAVRWRADWSGLPVAAPPQVQVTVAWELAAALLVPPRLTLRWVNGLERLTLFDYAADTRQFTDVSDGAAVGRFFIGHSQGQSFYMQGVEVLRVRDGVLAAAAFNEGRPPGGGPRVEFCQDGFLLMILTPSGVYVGNAREQAVTPPVAGTAAFYRTFQFADADEVVALLDDTGLTGSTLTEGLP